MSKTTQAKNSRNKKKQTPDENEQAMVVVVKQTILDLRDLFLQLDDDEFENEVEVRVIRLVLCACSIILNIEKVSDTIQF